MYQNPLSLSPSYLGASEDVIASYLEGYEDWDVGAAADFAGLPKSFGSNPKKALAKIAMMQPSKSLPAPLKVAAERMRVAARATIAQQASIEAWLARQPNNVAGVVESVATATAFSFTITPAPSQSSYEILALMSNDTSIAAFGISALVIGGLPHVTTSNNGTVANYAGTAFLSTRDQKMTGIQPWAGRVFQANSTITGTVRNFSAGTVVFELTLGVRSSSCQDYSNVASEYSAADRRRAFSRLF